MKNNAGIISRRSQRTESSMLTMHLFFAYGVAMTVKENRARFEKLKRSKDLATAKDLAETKRVDEVIRQLKAWRTRNNLSQRQAVFAMESRDCPVDIATLQQWEQGRSRPSNLAAKALETFLATYPTITDAPLYRKRTKLSAETIAEIRRLRKEGKTMISIGQRFGVDESYISRILSGERLAKSG
jgi:transcriptional regulator with XRE-family HTH domain